MVDNFELIDMADSNKYYMRYVYYDNLKVRLQYILLETLKKNLREINSSGYISNKSIINKNIENHNVYISELTTELNDKARKEDQLNATGICNAQGIY